ncbi:MAG: (2Fe-2S)-binding protein [Candidatus Aminicenantes bacterium]|nr:(2Fe-2S)-binding protein [Candidatus Aminicenantes bacterium]
MVKIFIDEKLVEAEEGKTILQAAEAAGIAIPHLCYHDAFEPRGTCRLCLVEIEGIPKLELSCSTTVKEGMKVRTQTDRVREARKGVLEFLLAEHPMDCPICDKAGECKLQDYYEEYGLFESSFAESKTRREKKRDIGKNLIHDQERCILCARCVRFMDEITRTSELGIFERGHECVVDVYDGMLIGNNYSGNLAELCPVGAITDKDFRFKTRTWFLDKGKSVCPLCSRGCNISIEHHKGFARFSLPKRVYRVRSEYNPQINSYWICDKGRYEYSYLDKNRQTTIHAVKNGQPVPMDWEQALDHCATEIKKLIYKNKTSRIAVVLHSWLSNEELFLAKKIFLDDLQAKHIYFSDLPSEEGDDFLLTSERSPNRKGALELGFDVKPFALKNVEDTIDILIVFGAFLIENFNPADIREALTHIPVKILITPQESELNPLMDLVIPSAHIAEKEGSLTNTDGIVQKFSPALVPPGSCHSELEFLSGLGKGIEENFSFYKRLSSGDAVRKKMAEDILFFREKE